MQIFQCLQKYIQIQKRKKTRKSTNKFKVHLRNIFDNTTKYTISGPSVLDAFYYPIFSDIIICFRYNRKTWLFSLVLKTKKLKWAEINGRLFKTMNLITDEK